jgi:hypothetical protein
VRCVRRIAREDVKSGVLPKECRHDVTQCASKSTCGKPGFVTCCIRRPGTSVVATNCRISPTTSACEDSGGESGGPGSCCDTCFGTTTTQPPVTTTSTTTSTTEASTTSTTETSTTSTTEESTTSTTESSTTTTSATSTSGTSTTEPGATTTSTMGGSTTTATTTTESSTLTTTTVTVTVTTSTSTTEASSTTVPTTIPTTTTEATTTTVTTTLASTTTTTLVCCPAAKIVTSSSVGILLVSTLAPFPFPAGVSTTVDVGAGDATCKHNAVVPPGGFSVPVFCIPALGFTSHVEASGCESGSGDGAGMVWDDTSPCPDADVSRVGDTSDPDGNNCGTLATGCNTAGTGAGNDTAGNINTTRGDGSCDTAAGVQTQLDIPVLSTTWNDVDGNCPDDDLTYDAGTDVLITQFTFILSPTTATTSADYTELNGDACSFAGNGPDHTKHCSLDTSRPCATNAHCMTPAPNAGTCVDGPINGTPRPGPCCVVGQATTVVASGIAFTGSAPLFDILFANQTPATVTACNAPSGADTCVVTTNPCQD